ncbi:MAG: heparan-alpha-glucosaminide N-acetyltransferase domain-containing protein [Chitinophagaceae bacterium]
MQKPTETPQQQSRLQSIDLLRGFVMIIMALDHVREYFSYTPYRPTDVTKASVLLFFTRWITHLCAPTFVFLSGIGIFLYCRKTGSLKKTSVFLLTRGLWLIVAEIFIISFILTQGYQLTLLEVIWAIGCSMILLAGLVWLPRWLQLTLALAMIFGHDALPMFSTVTKANMLFAFLHNSPFFIPNPPVLVAYTIVPWVGVMLLGYIIGTWFTYEQSRRNLLLISTGVSVLVFFIILRALNIYGDMFPWNTEERGGIYTFLSFLNVSKSPPSLLFLSVTLGISCLLLVLVDKFSAGIKKVLLTYGRVAFFFFILHLAIISLASYIWTYMTFGKPINLSFMSIKDWPAGYQPSLLRTYIIWIIVLIILYFPCKWYGNYKAKNKSWWLSYL